MKGPHLPETELVTFYLHYAFEDAPSLRKTANMLLYPCLLTSDSVYSRATSTSHKRSLISRILLQAKMLPPTALLIRHDHFVTSLQPHGRKKVIILSQLDSPSCLLHIIHNGDTIVWLGDSHGSYNLRIASKVVSSLELRGLESNILLISCTSRLVLINCHWEQGPGCAVGLGCQVCKTGWTELNIFWQLNTCIPMVYLKIGLVPCFSVLL